MLVVAALSWSSSAPAEQADDLDRQLEDSTWNPLNRLSAGHFRVADPQNLEPAEAEAVYRTLTDELDLRFARTDYAPARAYRDWRRYNSAPYKSVTHGRTYVNNYANAVAKAYGRYEAAGVLPVGSVVAKDSFAVTQSGDIRLGPLMLMEKMPAGFNPPSGDWRYTQILPDGSVLGTTNGDNDDKVNYCVPCHQKAGEGRDHLFFPKKPLRVLGD